MNSRAKALPVDPTKLEKELTERRINKNELSRTLGHHNGFITRCLRQRMISLPAACSLQSMYGIAYESYKPDDISEDPEPVEEPEQVPAAAVNMDDLYKILLAADQANHDILIHKLKADPLPVNISSEAVQKGMYSALRGFWMQYRQDIINAMIEALRKA